MRVLFFPASRFIAGSVLCIIACLWNNGRIYAQVTASEKLGFKEFSIHLPQWGQVNYYVSTKRLDSLKPLLLYLDGSGPFPLYQKLDKGFGSSVALDIRKLAEHYHIVLISKPGVPFVDSLKFNVEHGFPEYNEPMEYTRKLSLDWRVAAADAVLNKVVQDIRVDKRKISVMGISEGFQVGAKLASVNKKITHLMLFVGNGLNQFYDFILQARNSSFRGASLDSSQWVIDSLFQTFQDIYADQENSDKMWFGHTYLRWSSFCNNIPMENILSLDIPVYLVGCSQDENTTVASMDYLYLESLRLKKHNITYKVYPYDHSFTEIMVGPGGEKMKGANRMREVMDEGLKWLLSH